MFVINAENPDISLVNVHKMQAMKTLALNVVLNADQTNINRIITIHHQEIITEMKELVTELVIVEVTRQ